MAKTDIWRFFNLTRRGLVLDPQSRPSCYKGIPMADCSIISLGRSTFHLLIAFGVKFGGYCRHRQCIKRGMFDESLPEITMLMRKLRLEKGFSQEQLSEATGPAHYSAC